MKVLRSLVTLEVGKFVLDLKNFLELLVVFHNKNLGLGVSGDVPTSFGRVGGVNPSGDAWSWEKKEKKNKNDC